MLSSFTKSSVVDLYITIKTTSTGVQSSLSVSIDISVSSRSIHRYTYQWWSSVYCEKKHATLSLDPCPLICLAVVVSSRMNERMNAWMNGALRPVGYFGHFGRNSTAHVLIIWYQPHELFKGTVYYIIISN